MTVDEKIGNLLELAGLRHVENIIATIVQIVARAPDGAQGGVAGDHAGQRDGFFWLRCHRILPEF